MKTNDSKADCKKSPAPPTAALSPHSTVPFTSVLYKHKNALAHAPPSRIGVERGSPKAQEEVKVETVTVLHKPASLPAADRASREKKQHAHSRRFISAARGPPLIHTSYIYTHARTEGQRARVTLSNGTQISHRVRPAACPSQERGRVGILAPWKRLEVGLNNPFTGMVQVSWWDQNLRQVRLPPAPLSPPGGRTRQRNRTQPGGGGVIKKYKFYFFPIFTKASFTQVL